MASKSRALIGLGAALMAASGVQAQQTVPVQALGGAPAIDGDAADWSGEWIRIPIHPAMEDDDDNTTGKLEVELQAGVAGERLYLIARWPDAEADTNYRPWEWKRNRYKRSRRDRDDMFAVRFDMAGDFNTCMIEDANYDVDVWLWSAGRSNEKRYATDMWHRITLNMMENAAEYESPMGRTVYIKKYSDEGTPGFENSRPNRRKHQGDELPGIDFLGEPSGSVADVTAQGGWKDGVWTLELSRLLETGHDDDVVLKAGEQKRGQIAVFNKNYAEHKSVSDQLLFDFSAL